MYRTARRLIVPGQVRVDHPINQFFITVTPKQNKSTSLSLAYSMPTVLLGNI